MAHRRARLESKALAEREPPIEVGAATEVEIIACERYRHLEDAMATLSHKLREVVVLRFSAGLRYQEIAETLIAPMGTVKRRLFDALAILHQRMRNVG